MIPSSACQHWSAEQSSQPCSRTPSYTTPRDTIHKYLDVNSALVLSAVIKEQMSKFSWGGNGATLGRLQKTRIMVPMTTCAEGKQVLDWKEMTRYGRALRVKVERTSFANTQIAGTFLHSMPEAAVQRGTLPS
jgi:hypothetical protein